MDRKDETEITSSYKGRMLYPDLLWGTCRYVYSKLPGVLTGGIILGLLVIGVLGWEKPDWPEWIYFAWICFCIVACLGLGVFPALRHYRQSVVVLHFLKVMIDSACCFDKALLRIWFRDEETAAEVLNSMGSRIRLTNKTDGNTYDASYWTGRFDEIGYRRRWHMMPTSAEERERIYAAYARAGAKWYNYALLDGRSLWLACGREPPTSEISLEMPEKSQFLSLYLLPERSRTLRRYLGVLPEIKEPYEEKHKCPIKDSREAKSVFLRQLIIFLLQHYSKHTAIVDLEPTLQSCQGYGTVAIGADTVYHHAQLGARFIMKAGAERVEFYLPDSCPYINRERVFDVQLRHFSFPIRLFFRVLEVGFKAEVQQYGTDSPETVAPSQGRDLGEECGFEKSQDKGKASF